MSRLPFDEYWSDKRFRSKRSHWRKGASTVQKCGDNCYEPTVDGGFRQLPGGHWDHENNRENLQGKATDLGGKRVLVGQKFCYFGRDAVAFPSTVHFKRPERFYRVNFTQQEKSALLEFLESLPQGIHGQPKQWPKDDATWRERGKRCG